MGLKPVAHVTKVVNVVKPKPKKARLTIKSSVDGVIVEGFDVYLNGTKVGTTTYMSEVDPGTYSIRVVPNATYSSQVDPSEYTTSITLSEGEDRTVTATFTGKNPPQAKGYISVYAYVDSKEANFDTYIDDTLVGKTPIENYEVDAGTHHVKVIGVDTNPSTYEEDVTVGENESKTVTAKFSPSNVIQTGELVVRSFVDDKEVTGFTVEIDGITGTTPFDETINVGTYNIKVTPLPGYDVEPTVFEATVSVGPNEKREVRADFRSVVPPPPPDGIPPVGKAIIQVMGYINGRPTKLDVTIASKEKTLHGYTPYKVEVDPGTYTITVKPPIGGNYYPKIFKRTYEVHAGEILFVQAKFTYVKPTPKIPTWVYLATALGAGAGIYYLTRKKIL